ncbi:MAG: hypothetical protein B6U86_00055 [Candidatus Altiarchaeales archaeon ex4484_43]|nr:MAG: hypothetical protein B6U86_00055 [Candidatus Altiarchaeales archaeon ex4484_43]
MAGGTYREDSDLDIGVLLDDAFREEPLYLARLAREIKLGCNIDRSGDVQILNHCSLRFLHQVLRNGELILSRDEGKRGEFESTALCRYIDLKPFYREYDEERRRGAIGMINREMTEGKIQEERCRRVH